MPRLWPGETFVCIGGGPSLTPSDVESVRGKARVIAINDAYKLALWADVLYACDAKWWDWHQGVPSFAGVKYALEPGASKWGVQIIANTGEMGLEETPTGVKTGRNSGYQAINLAVHLGAARILLLGYDMAQGPSGEEHWFGDHPNGKKNTSDLYAHFRSRFATMVEPLQRLGISVVNCSRRTLLEAFPVVALEDAL